MYPILFKYQLPEFLQHWLGVSEVTLYSYAFCIVLGTLLAANFGKRESVKNGLGRLPNSFFYVVFMAGFVGGKLFYWLENPMFYYNNPSLLLDNFSGGFVFYGSFITIIPVAIWYLKQLQFNVLAVLDFMAIATLIAHSFGRIGCFLAGCCYGKPTDSFIGIVFPTTHGVKVIPTQLIEVFILSAIGFTIFNIYKKTHKTGTVFCLYIALYALSRFFIEFLRGDYRGVILNGLLSHSQTIAIVLFIIAMFLLRNNKLVTKIQKS